MIIIIFLCLGRQSHPHWSSATPPSLRRQRCTSSLERTPKWPSSVCSCS